VTCEVVNLRREEYDIYIGRGDGGDAHLINTEVDERGWLGNPYTVEDFGREKSIQEFKKVFRDQLEANEEFREAVRDLDGKTLGCFCKPKDCHGDVIAEEVERLNQEAGETDG
jgi:hypothetical protein